MILDQISAFHKKKTITLIDITITSNDTSYFDTSFFCIEMKYEYKPWEICKVIYVCG